MRWTSAEQRTFAVGINHLSPCDEMAVHGSVSVPKPIPVDPRHAQQDRLRQVDIRFAFWGSPAEHRFAFLRTLRLSGPTNSGRSTSGSTVSAAANFVDKVKITCLCGRLFRISFFLVSAPVSIWVDEANPRDKVPSGFSCPSSSTFIPSTVMSLITQMATL
jgi:hypothetical protein